MFEWFTTIPGILVIGGVILLVIAIILFVLGAKKDKNTVIKEEINEDVQQSNVEINNDLGIQSVPEVQEQPAVEPTVDVVSESVVDNVVNDIPAVVEETPEIVMISDESVNNSDIQPISVELAEPAMVYAEQQPVVDISVEEKPVTIYGGNDPLEATQKLPLIEENHIPYGGSYSEPVVEPVIEPVTPISTIDFGVSSQPEITDVSVETNVFEPEIKPIVEPVVETVIPEVENKNISEVEEL